MGLEAVTLVFAGTALLIFGVARFVQDPRRLSTSFILLAAVTVTACGGGAFGTQLLPVALPQLQVGLVLAMLPALAGTALIVNGVLVARREGVAAITLTPVVVGFGLLSLAIAAATISVDVPVPPWGIQLIIALSVLGLYLVAHLIAFAVQALIYSRLPDRLDADAVIVLGCGLNRSVVTPLLAARLDRALRVYRNALASGYFPALVTCGGCGPGENTAEADAMAAYLESRGVDGPAVVRERRSRTTEENLSNALDELHARGVPLEALRITIVTSNFHVLRTAALTRRLGVDAQVLGARTAGYFIPAAFLREYFAVLATHYRRAHLAVAVGMGGAMIVVLINAYLALAPA